MKKRAGCKCIAKLLSVVMFIGCLWTGGFDARALEPDDNVELSESNFPDETFREYLRDTYDTDGDGYISASSVTIIQVDEMDINSLDGIELFYSLRYLSCSNTKISALDVSKNLALQTLYCKDTKISELDVSANPVLYSLDCSRTKISELDVSANPALQILDCYGTNISALDVSENPALQILYCSNTNISALDVSANPALQDLRCSDTKISALDVSANSALRDLYCSHTNISALDVSANPALQILDCYGTNISMLDVSANPALQILVCSETKISALDVSANPALWTLQCSNTKISELDVSKNPALRDLQCSNTKISALDVNENPVLYTLYCANTNISALDVTSNLELWQLNCAQNCLTELDISKNSQLDELWCGGNQLQELDTSYNPMLSFLNILEEDACMKNLVLNCAIVDTTEKPTAQVTMCSNASYNGAMTLTFYVNQSTGMLDLSGITNIHTFVGSEGWDAGTSTLTYTLAYDDSLKQDAFVSGNVVLLKKTPCAHTDTYRIRELEATCTTMGYTGDTVCRDCGETIQKGVEIAHKHGELEIRYANEATCGHAGYTGDKYCKECNGLVEEGTEIPQKTEHGELEIRYANEATCGHAGYTGDKYCKECYRLVEVGTEIPQKTEHGELEIRYACETTCNSPAYTGDKICKDCGIYVESGEWVYGNYKKHDWQDNICTMCGERDLSVSALGYMNTQSITPDSDVVLKVRVNHFIETDVNLKDFSVVFKDSAGNIMSRADVVQSDGSPMQDKTLEKAPGIYDHGWCKVSENYSLKITVPSDYDSSSLAYFHVKYGTDDMADVEYEVPILFQVMITVGEAIELSDGVAHTSTVSEGGKSGDIMNENYLESVYDARLYKITVPAYSALKLSITDYQETAYADYEGIMYFGFKCRVLDENGIWTGGYLDSDGTEQIYNNVGDEAETVYIVVNSNRPVRKPGEFDANFTLTATTQPIVEECRHSETEVKDAKPATCTEDGYTGDTVCKSCGEIVEAGTVIEKTEHSYTDGKCSVCGADDPNYVPPCTHNETEVKNAKSATCIAEGYTGDKVCKTCGEVLETGTAIAKTAHSYTGGKCSVCGADDPDYVAPIPMSEWKQDSTGWWYQRADGSYPANAWEEIDGKWYHFDASGYMQTGWQEIDGKWYYLYDDGSMAANTTIDGYTLDASGAWVQGSSNSTQDSTDGAQDTGNTTVTAGWKQDLTGWWYRRADGSYPRDAWEKIDGKWYLFDIFGYILTGWQQSGGIWYYLYDDGSMASDTTIDGYTLDASGAWVQGSSDGTQDGSDDAQDTGNTTVTAGWKQDSAGWWYQRADGSYPINEWERISGTWYHFNDSGYMQTGWLLDAGTWYYAEGNGAFVTGWQVIGQAWYFFYNSCAMAADTVIDGYRIAASGEWIQ